jgi:hypothetical protein
VSFDAYSIYKIGFRRQVSVKTYPPEKKKEEELEYVSEVKEWKEAKGTYRQG